MKYQKGFTLPEIAMTIAALMAIGFVGLTIWAAVHFIAKYW